MAFKTHYKCTICDTKFWEHPEDLEVCPNCYHDSGDKLCCVYCEYYTAQYDRNNVVTTTFCKHPENSCKEEGNTTDKCCPILKK